MKHLLPNLESLKVFEAAARHSSFSNAAEELCITKGAVSYQIKKLEEQLGINLFTRSVRQVHLTDNGILLQQSVQPAFHQLGIVVSKLRQSKNTTAITIGVTTYVAARWLSPKVTDFCITNPDVSLQFQHTVNSSTVDHDSSDIVIRWDNCKIARSDSVLRKIPMDLFPVCSPDLKNSANNNIQEMTLLCEERKQDLWQEWAGDEFDISRSQRRVIADANVRVQAAVDGQGVVLADEMMQAELNSGALVPVTSRKLSGYGYLIICSSENSSVQVNSLLRWLCD